MKEENVASLWCRPFDNTNNTVAVTDIAVGDLRAFNDFMENWGKGNCNYYLWGDVERYLNCTPQYMAVKILSVERHTVPDAKVVRDGIDYKTELYRREYILLVLEDTCVNLDKKRVQLCREREDKNE